MSDSEDNIFMQFFMETPTVYTSSSESSSSANSIAENEELARSKRAKIMNFVEDVVKKYDEVQFKSHFRMSRRTVDQIIGIILIHIIKMYTNYRCDISDRFNQSRFMPKYPSGRENVTPEKSVLLTIWYLANRNSFREIADRFGLSMSTTHNCLTRVIEFLCSIKEEIIKWPNIQRRRTIQNAFASNDGIEGAIGAIDGSHIEIAKPKENQDSYINRKGFASLLLQGVVDHEKIFIDVFCGEPGSLHDARLLRRSALYAKMLDNPEFMGENFLLADSAYPNLNWIVTPFQDTGFLTEHQKLFNKRLSSKRVVLWRI